MKKSVWAGACIARVMAGLAFAMPAALAFADSVRVTDYGAKGDGRTDDTYAFKRAAATGLPIVVPASASFYVIREPITLTNSITGVQMPELRMIDPDGTGETTILRVTGDIGSTILVSGLHLNGGWDEVLPPAGTDLEHSHGIALLNAHHVVVQYNKIERTFGDNIYVGAKDGHNSENITIRNNDLSSPRRCNVAVTAGRNVRILGNTMQKDNDYVASVDLEPNNDNRTSVAIITVSGNTIKMTKGRFVSIYSNPPTLGYDQPMSDLVIANNTIQAQYGVVKSVKTGTIQRVHVSGNSFHGVDMLGGTYLVKMDHDTSTGTVLYGVYVEKNVDWTNKRLFGSADVWLFRNAQRLVVQYNELKYYRDPWINVVNCPGAIVSDNILPPAR